MTDIDEIKIRRLDLTVLLVFLRLMREGKGTLVGEQMGLTQSSISHALKRLRNVFGDDLFLRRPYGLEPTAFALALEPRIASIVATLREALNGPAAFEPANSVRLFRLAAFDLHLATMLPPLLTRLEAMAPMLRVSAEAPTRREVFARLATGEIDMAVGYFWENDPDMIKSDLYHENYLVVAPTGHAALHGDLESFAAARHVVVSPNGDLRGVVDAALESIGMTRRVDAAVPSFFPALAVAAESGLVATLPRMLVEKFAGAFGLACAEPPLPLRSFTVSAMWHRRDARNPFHLWMTEQLSAVAGELGLERKRSVAG
jgi:DNA-binding transcriptional LysR family regulator